MKYLSSIAFCWAALCMSAACAAPASDRECFDKMVEWEKQYDSRSVSMVRDNAVVVITLIRPDGARQELPDTGVKYKKNSMKELQSNKLDNNQHIYTDIKVAREADKIHVTGLDYSTEAKVQAHFSSLFSRDPDNSCRVDELKVVIDLGKQPQTPPTL